MLAVQIVEIVDFQALLQASTLKLAGIVALIFGAYFGFLMLKKSLRYSSAYILFESKAERRERLRIDNAWDRALKDDAKRERQRKRRDPGKSIYEP
jgi:hypothetical protein